MENDKTTIRLIAVIATAATIILSGVLLSHYAVRKAAFESGYEQQRTIGSEEWIWVKARNEGKGN